jgi:hypothetical protein
MKTKPPVPSLETLPDTYQAELDRTAKEIARLSRQNEEPQTELILLAERTCTRTAEEHTAQKAIDQARTAHNEAQLKAELLALNRLVLVDVALQGLHMFAATQARRAIGAVRAVQVST